MANILTGVPRSAINSSGGCEYFLIADFATVKVSETDGVATIVMNDGKDTAIDSSNNPFLQYWPKKESSNVAENWTGTVATGQGFSEQIATIVFSKNDTKMRNEIKMLASMETIVIGVDFNGYNQLMGMRSGCDLITNAGGTGTAGGDLNGSTLTLRAKDPDFMPTVDIKVMEIINVPKA